MKILIKGIFDYASLSGDRYFVGEVGIPCTDVERVVQVRSYLSRHGMLSDAFHVRPRVAPDLPAPVDIPEHGDSGVERLIPAMYSFCFRNGAKASPVPRIVDAGGNRTDFFLFADFQTARFFGNHELR